MKNFQISKRVAVSVIAVILVLFLSGLNVSFQKSNIIGIGTYEIVISDGRANASETPDYVTDGIADNVEVQAALNRLGATGGKLRFTEGTYTFSANVTRAIDNVTIEGTGRGTYFVLNGANPMWTAGGNNWIFQDLRTDAGSINMGATTGWQWRNITINATFYSFRSPEGAATFDNVTIDGLTNTRIPIVGAGGLIGDDAGLTYNTTTDVMTTTRFDDANTINITIGANGCDYTTLNAAYTAINDATSSKRYTFHVYGLISETTYILPEGYIDVIGHNAEVRIDCLQDSCVTWAIDTPCTWRDIIIKKTGVTANVVGRFSEYITRNVVIDNVTFINTLADTIDGGQGVLCQRNSSPVFRNCIFKGGGKSYGYAFHTAGNASPLLIGCIAEGATSGRNNHGFLVDENSSPTFISCTGIQGGGREAGNTTSYGFAIAPTYDSNVVMEGCLGTYKETAGRYNYNSASPDFTASASYDYQVLSMSVYVSAAQPGLTLDIGTSDGGHEIAQNVDLTATGTKTFVFNRFTKTAGQLIYTTPSGAAGNSCFKIYYTWTTNYTNSPGLLLYSSGYIKISNSMFLSPSASSACIIPQWASSYNSRWSIQNCTFETLGAVAYAVGNTTGNNITGANFNSCTLIGLKDSTLTFSDETHKITSGFLTAGNANAIGFAWHNPELYDILILKVVIEVTTGSATANSVIDVGIADDATGTNRGVELFDDLDANDVDINDSWVAGDGGTQTKWVLCQDSVSATDGWIVGQILVADAAALVGKYYIEYVGR